MNYMKDLMEKIDEYIKDNTCTLTFGDGSDEFAIQVNDYVDADTLAAVVDDIAFNVRNSEFDYYLFDILMAYHVISLFTDIPIPAIKTEESETQDYTKCYDICARLNLINELCSASGNIEEYIEFIEKNVWRKLEYYKELAANDALMMVCGKAYELLDELEGIVEQATDVDLQTVMSELKDASAQVLDLKEEAAKMAAKQLANSKEQGAE